MTSDPARVVGPLSTASAILVHVPLLCEARRASGRRRLYLVGGAVRDALLGRPMADLDLLVEDAPKVAARFARSVGGKLVLLHEDWPVARVVVGRGARRRDFDFASPRADSVCGDLQARDFTVNGIAAGPLGAHPRLIDPCHGRHDCSRRLVRMTSPAALETDPVRVVRAYRFASELGFRVDKRTHRECRRLAERVCLCPGERVGAEMVKLFAGASPSRALDGMSDAGVLQIVIPELAPAVGMWQGGAHEYDVFAHSLFAVERLLTLIDQAPQVFPDHAGEVRAYAGDGERRAALVLATLLHDVAKPECRVWEGGRWRFFAHESRGAQVADRIAARLRLPKRLRRQIKLLVGAHMRLLPILGGDHTTERAKRRLVRDLGADTTGLVLLSLADRRALRHDIGHEGERVVAARLESLLAVARGMVRHPHPSRPLVTGTDLIALGLEPGPVFREVLEAIEEAWSAGEVATREEALQWVTERLKPRKHRHTGNGGKGDDGS